MVLKKITIAMLSLTLLFTPVMPVAAAPVVVAEAKSEAALPLLTIIKEALKKIIKAIDLRIQRLQNKTIWLQNAQKQIENALSKLKLDEISEWTEKQKELYKGYYEELMKVKAMVSYYQRIRDIVDKQERLVSEYQNAWGLLQQDDHFTPNEITYMEKVYNGILGESIENIDVIFMVVESFTTSMSDAERLEMINETADRIEANYDDLKLFNKQNMLLSLQRARSKADVDMIKRMYGLP
ncbi:conjugal transfer protein TraI [Flavobacterium sp. Sd200]|uniref:conjugal transfer protein TraI n=1 Tax=Flavobacterium sp. Sd200 TaxID=2692211 RepID=UPI001368FB0F|nr:conjugal transfer protein TraI [Flavobacterium sp. Sd200]MXN91735.1 conjugal transfer protein TraI [Flavobacterium sp. Sd200]